MLDVSIPPVAVPATARRRVRVPRAVTDLALALAPAVVSLVLLHHWLGHSPRAYLPIQSDEVSYWHQIASFAKVGFDNGYYTYQEYTPPALSAYGAWGPVFPALFGLLVAVLGVSYPVIVWLNLATFTGLAFVALRLARADRARVFLVGAVLVTYTPLLLYLPSGMQEPLHLGLAALLAVAFHRLLVAEAGVRRRPAVVAFALVVLASLLRPTWALLLVPAALLAARGRGWKTVPGALAGGFAGAVGLAALFPLWAAPAPYGYTYQIRHGATLATKLSLFGANVWRNVTLYFQVHTSVLQNTVTQRAHLIGILVAALAVAIVATARREWRTGHVTVAAWTVVLALLPSLLFIVFFYDIGNGTRVLAAHTLFAGVFVALLRPRWALVVPAVLIVTNLLTVPWFQHDFVLRNSVNFAPQRSSIEANRAALAQVLHYQPDGDRWCNTVLLADDHGFAQTTAVPAGFGVGVDLNHRFQGRLRSAYVLATGTTLPYLPARLVLVAKTPEGGLYRNLDSPCFS
jgi:hypothetical protein